MPPFLLQPHPVDGYDLVKFKKCHVPLVKLKILPPKKFYNKEANSLDLPYHPVSEWLVEKDAELLTREADPKNLHDTFLWLWQEAIEEYEVLSPALKPEEDSGVPFVDGNHPYTEDLEEFPEQDEDMCRYI
jgi:hypothetical protein